MIEGYNAPWRTITATIKSRLLMATGEVLRHLLLPTTERSIAIVIGSIFTGILTDPVATSTTAALHGPTISGNTCRMKIVAALSIDVSKSIVDLASMAMTEIGRRSADTAMTRTAVMTDATTDGATSIVLAIAIVMIVVMTVGMTVETTDVMTVETTDVMTVETTDVMTVEMTVEMTDVMTVEMTVDMTDIVKIVIGNASANGPKTRTLRMSAEPMLLDGWMSFAELVTTRINEHKTTML
jgi:hypothetical protein